MNENEKTMPKVHVIDAVMGSGKSCAAINYINSLPDDVKVIYVTPYNHQKTKAEKEAEEKYKSKKGRKRIIAPNEVARIIDACKEKDFAEPQFVNNRKVNGLKELIVGGRNIATTHALFHLMAMDKEIISLCREQGYILFMDEVTEVIKTYDGLSKKSDLDILLKGTAERDEKTGEIIAKPLATMDDNGFLNWVHPDYTGSKFSPERKLIENNALACYGGKKNAMALVELFPIDAFTAFDEVFILTYMFDAQLQSYYYKYHGIEYDYWYVKGNSPETYSFTSNIAERTQKSVNYKKLINLYTDPKIEKICKKRNALSLNWFINNSAYNKGAIIALKNSLYTFFRRGTDKGKGSHHDRLWTTFKEFRDDVKDRGNKEAFLHINARATNECIECDAVAYIANRYLNPLEKRFFETNGITVNENDFALSELLQFVWRSAIREGKPIDLYIPSKRMRELLEQWIDENSTESAP